MANEPEMAIFMQWLIIFIMLDIMDMVQQMIWLVLIWVPLNFLPTWSGACYSCYASILRNSDFNGQSDICLLFSDISGTSNEKIIFVDLFVLVMVLAGICAEWIDYDAVLDNNHQGGFEFTTLDKQRIYSCYSG